MVMLSHNDVVCERLLDKLELAAPRPVHRRLRDQVLSA